MQQDVAVGQFLQLRAIVFDMAPLVVETCAGELRELPLVIDDDATTLQDRPVGLGPDEAHGSPLSDDCCDARFTTRRDAIPGFGRQTEAMELLFYRLGSSRGVGNEDDRPPFPAPLQEPIRGAGIGQARDNRVLLESPPDPRSTTPVGSVAIFQHPAEVSGLHSALSGQGRINRQGAKGAKREGENQEKDHGPLRCLATWRLILP